MLYKFDTESVEHAKCALLMYALYKSRDKNSPLNGIETWDRFNSFVRGACLKSTNMREFVQNFCRKAKIESIKPYILATDDLVVLPDTGEVIQSKEWRNYNINIFEDDSLLNIINNETLYIITLVRERIQREKLNGEAENYADEN
mgnify:CR=1 FL=1